MFCKHFALFHSLSHGSMIHFVQNVSGGWDLQVEQLQVKWLVQGGPVETKRITPCQKARHGMPENCFGSCAPFFEDPCGFGKMWHTIVTATFPCPTKLSHLVAMSQDDKLILIQQNLAVLTTTISCWDITFTAGIFVWWRLLSFKKVSWAMHNISIYFGMHVLEFSLILLLSPRWYDYHKWP